MESTKIDSKSAIGRSFIGAQSQFYRDASEAIPAIPENTSEAIPAIPEKRPEPQGKSMSTHCFVDAKGSCCRDSQSF
jgi:hypothetical protein